MLDFLETLADTNATARPIHPSAICHVTAHSNERRVLIQDEDHCQMIRQIEEGGGAAEEVEEFRSRKPPVAVPQLEL